MQTGNKTSKDLANYYNTELNCLAEELSQAIQKWLSLCREKAVALHSHQTNIDNDYFQYLETIVEALLIIEKIHLKVEEILGENFKIGDFLTEYNALLQDENGKTIPTKLTDLYSFEEIVNNSDSLLKCIIEPQVKQLKEKEHKIQSAISAGILQQVWREKNYINTKGLSVEEIKKRFGGKAGFIMYMKEKLETEHGLSFCLPGNIKLIPPFQKTVDYCLSLESGIIRPSIEGDETGLVDVAESIILSNQYKIFDIEKTQKYINKYSQLFDGRGDKDLKCLIFSDYIKSPLYLKGQETHSSITNHPHIENHYIVSFLNGRYELLIDNEGVIIKVHEGFITEHQVSNYAPKSKIIKELKSCIGDILDMKQYVDGLGFTNKNVSSQTEFKIGEGNNIYLLQEREFLEYSYQENYLKKNFGSFQNFGLDSSYFEGISRISYNDLSLSEQNTPKVLLIKYQYIFDLDYLDRLIDTYNIVGVEFLDEKGDSGIGTMGHNSYRWIFKFKNSWRK